MFVDIPHLRYVVAAADHDSFRRAAAALNITQPTLSKRIRELEDRLEKRTYLVRYSRCGQTRPDKQLNLLVGPAATI